MSVINNSLDKVEKHLAVCQQVHNEYQVISNKVQNSQKVISQNKHIDVDSLTKRQYQLSLLHKFVVEQLKIAIDKQFSFAK